MNNLVENVKGILNVTLANDNCIKVSTTSNRNYYLIIKNEDGELKIQKKNSTTKATIKKHKEQNTTK